MDEEGVEMKQNQLREGTINDRLTMNVDNESETTKTRSTGHRTERTTFLGKPNFAGSPIQPLSGVPTA